ncbi:MAG: glycoside hydrolase family 28 protein [Tepidisphaerales bacterium]
MPSVLRRRISRFIAVFFVLTALVSAGSAAESASWDQVPAILARIKAPVFPDRDFSILDFGAKPDGVADCSDAFRKAITAANTAGGGRVLVPAGNYLSGAIHLKSNVNLHLAEGATIKFSTDPKQYLPAVFTRWECVEVMNYSAMIYAFEQENIAITGKGTLDGQARNANWWAWKDTARADVASLMKMAGADVPVAQRVFGDGHFLRPNLLQPVRCRNMLIEGVTVKNSPMWTINPVYCTNVIVRGVTAEGNGPNTDGCDPDSCTDVLIENCTFNTGDDCIAIKSGRDRDGHRVNIPCQNIIIRGCTMKNGHGGITCGSESAGDIRNVFAEDCTLSSPNLLMAIRLKTSPERGGVIEDVFVRNCTILKAGQAGIHMTLKYSSGPGAYTPVIRRIDIRNCRFSNVPRAIFIEGLSESARITDVTVQDCTFEKVAGRNAISNAGNVRLINVKVDGKAME